MARAYTEARKASNKKSDAKYQQIMVKPYISEGNKIREAAAQAGQSVQQYILQAVDERMQRDGQPGIWYSGKAKEPVE